MIASRKELKESLINCSIELMKVSKNNTGVLSVYQQIDKTISSLIGKEVEIDIYILKETKLKRVYSTVEKNKMPRMEEQVSYIDSCVSERNMIFPYVVKDENTLSETETMILPLRNGLSMHGCIILYDNGMNTKRLSAIGWEYLQVTFSTILENLGSAEVLEKVSNTNPESNLPGEACLTKRIQNLMKSGQLGSYVFVLMQLQNVQSIIECFSYNAGIKIVRNTAYEIKKAIQESDSVFALHSDSFAILIKNDLRTTYQWVEKFLHYMNKEGIQDKSIDEKNAIITSLKVAIIPINAVLKNDIDSLYQVAYRLINKNDTINIYGETGKQMMETEVDPLLVSSFERDVSDLKQVEELPSVLNETISDETLSSGVIENANSVQDEEIQPKKSEFLDAMNYITSMMDSFSFNEPNKLCDISSEEKSIVENQGEQVQPEGSELIDESQELENDNDKSQDIKEYVNEIDEEAIYFNMDECM